jgi:hypothetical protein
LQVIVITLSSESIHIFYHYDSEFIYLHAGAIMSMPKNRKRLPLSKKTRTTKRDVAASAITTDDINMLLRIAELYNTSYDFEAAEWFWGQYKETINFEEFRNKYPQGSKGAQLFERFTSKFELAGILIEYGFLDENLYFDRYGDIQIEWESSKSVISGIRKEWNYPRFRENFELLAIRGRKWLETHLPKIKESIE